jgi:hypothetical protein
MLAWWRHWVVRKQQQLEQLDAACLAMEGYTVHRCVVWSMPGWLWGSLLGSGWLALDCSAHTGFDPANHQP